MKYQEHRDLPAWEQAQWKDGHSVEPSPGKVRWSNEKPPPPIGSKIVVTINSCGPALVTGYFTQEGWLGVICDLTDPPDWLLKQNKGNRRGHAFGAELRIEQNFQITVDNSAETFGDKTSIADLAKNSFNGETQLDADRAVAIAERDWRWELVSTSRSAEHMGALFKDGSALRIEFRKEGTN